jgi:predicted TIM-barrel fold metal-dependent hydrolase
MTENARKAIANRVELFSKRSSVPVVDADTHISDPKLEAFHARPPDLAHPDDYYHGKPISAEQLIAMMDASGIDMSLAWQNPAVTKYTGSPDEDYQSLLAANTYIHDAARRYPDRILPAGWTDPQALGVEGALRMARHCVEQLGFPIVKMNPAQNEFPIDDDRVAEVVDLIVSLGATPAFHFGADTPFTPPEGLVRAAARIEPRQVIAVHMGGGGAGYVEAEPVYREARTAGLHQANIHYILSAKRETHMESDLITYEAAGEPFRGNISCASDAPYGLPHWCFAGFRAMLRNLASPEAHTDERVRSGKARFSQESIAGYLGGNFVQVYERACRSVPAACA